jgi:DNA-binding MarR family transcriptional regulator
MKPTPAETEMWLDEEEQRAWRGVVKLYTKLPAALDGELQRTADLTLFEYEILAILSESDERRLQMSELAAEANSSLSRLSHVVTRMEKRNWVTREASPNNRRASQAVLTECGLAKVVDAAPGHVRAVRDLVVDAITPAQLRQLGAAGVKIGQRIENWQSKSSQNTDCR